MTRGRTKPLFAPVERNIMSITGMPGAHLQGTEIKPLEFGQPIAYVSKDDKSDLELKDELAEWLITDEPAPLEFDDEPGRIYYALVQNTIEDFERISILRQGTIKFLCLDPYSYGPEKTQEFQSDADIITNEGTAEADPIFELEVINPVTFAMVQNDNEEYMMIGKPADVDEEVVDTEQLLLEEHGETLDTWQLPPGTWEGSFTTNGAQILVKDYGTGDSWHGPGLMKEVPPTQDFEIEMSSYVRSERADQTFRVSANFYDEGMNELGMMRVWDKKSRQKKMDIEARVGPFVERYFNYPISDRNYSLKDQRVWNGIIRVTRKGNTFTFYAARISQRGNHFDTITEVYHDVNNEFAGKLKFIRFDMAHYGSTNHTNEAMINYIRVSEQYQVNVDQTPYIARPGDIITFDHKDDEILINGEDRKDLKDFGGSFFKLAKGSNQLIVEPSDSFNTRVSYRNRYR